MKLFFSDQIAEIDRYTIEHEPILSVNLMERAVKQVFDWFKKHIDTTSIVHVFVGPGNNGGDGLALARMLVLDGWSVSVYLVQESGSLSADARINLDRLRVHPKSKIFDLTDRAVSFPNIESSDVVVDAIFGSGLKRPCTGLALKTVKSINLSGAKVVAIDIPTGLMGEDNRQTEADGIVVANHTLTFQFPRLSFLMADNARYIGQWVVLDIGLHPAAIAQTPSDFVYLEISDIASRIKHRPRHCHKGDFGHALLCAGRYGMIGAAVLAAKGCLRAGAGLLTVHLPQCGVQIMQTTLPEAIVNLDGDMLTLSVPPDELNKYNAIGIGPGIGQDILAVTFLDQLLDRVEGKRLVLDADALNIMAHHAAWWFRVPQGTIITPHPGEFDRLTKHHSDGYARMQSAMSFAKEHGVVVVLKGAHTLIVLPSGKCFFNSTGNAGLATAGSGDVLTGIILGLLAQGYTCDEAAIVGVYIHGLAADLALDNQSVESLMASDVLIYLGQAYLQIRTFDGLD